MLLGLEKLEDRRTSGDMIEMFKTLFPVNQIFCPCQVVEQDDTTKNYTQQNTSIKKSNFFTQKVVND